MKNLIYIFLFLPFILNGQALTRNDSVFVRNDSVIAVEPQGLYDGLVLWVNNQNTPSKVGEGVSLALDRSGYGNNATQTTPAYEPLQADSGFYFDGINDYLVTNNQIDKYPFSIGFWFRKPDISLNKSIVSIDDENRGDVEFSIYTSVSSLLIYRRNTNPYIITIKGSFISTDQWYHAVVIFVNETTLKGYVNNVLELNSSIEPNVTYNSDFDKIVIGVLRLTAPTFFNIGHVDNIMIYNRAITETEIEYIYNSQKNKYQ